MNIATTKTPLSDIEVRERLFFLKMACAIVATVLVGFGTFLALGISSFKSPWWVHVHAVTFMSWIAVYFYQNWLIYHNEPGRHRRLGRFAALLALWMLVVGIVLTPLTVAVARVPPFFTPAFFLTLDWVNIAGFAVLISAALYFRRQTDWHRRLMLCATIAVMAPAIGRLLALAGKLNEWTCFGVLLVYVAIAMVADFRRHKRIHPAYFWGGAVILSLAPIIHVMASLQFMQDLGSYFVGLSSTAT